MAYGFNTTMGTGSTDEIIASASTTYPSNFSVHIWSNRNADTTLARMWSYGPAGANDDIALVNRNSEAAGEYGIFVQAGPSGKFSWARPSGSAWHSIGMAFNIGTSGTTPTIYQDGSSVSVTTVTAYDGSIAARSQPLRIGNRGDAARVFDGQLAEVAAWNALLDASEFAALAKGVPPLLVRPSALIEYVPLVRNLASAKLSGAFTTNGTPIVRPHPPIFRSKRRTAHFLEAGGPAPPTIVLEYYSSSPSIRRVQRQPWRW